ncbi:uncharacterized protein SETTUDRAFT_22723 [Exserohilum turcica Et28A]|uniref:Uncharacterized protein n=1 Tax=Exserohilum turcicum (strain 28A) TaxID=671987 RepID=R0IBH5_EXST2|nr:uncharacterized protein SETTUDRAFT_22723 [Exserohilum turcica Et28A]EOA82755.1 hypothetical protein SETTUDRAFT_22723 [Exserohilum turcica Et28A]
MSMEYAGGISTMVLALIAMGIIAALLGLMILTAIIIDLPNRKRRKESPGIMETIDLEKGFETEAVHKSIIECTTLANATATELVGFVFDFGAVTPGLRSCDGLRSDCTATRCSETSLAIRLYTSLALRYELTSIERLIFATPGWSHRIYLIGELHPTNSQTGLLDPDFDNPVSPSLGVALSGIASVSLAQMSCV